MHACVADSTMVRSFDPSWPAALVGKPLFSYILNTCNGVNWLAITDLWKGPQSSLSARAASHHRLEPEGRQEVYYNPNLYITKQMAGLQTDTALLPERNGGAAHEAPRLAGWLNGQDKWCGAGKDGIYHSPCNSRSYLRRSFWRQCHMILAMLVFSMQQFGNTNIKSGWSCSSPRLTRHLALNLSCANDLYKDK